MKVFKFGGASVRSSEGVKNLVDIVRDQSRPLFIVVSAMGKTTNALENILELYVGGGEADALCRFDELVKAHNIVIEGLFGVGQSLPEVDRLFGELRDIITAPQPSVIDYDVLYDRMVSYGELVSTRIISDYLNHVGINNRWIDMRCCFITDDRHRDANIDIDISTGLLCAKVDGAKKEGVEVFVGQGFIGATDGGKTTTLGREGSDYSAAVAAHMLGAESVAIWKDVEGVLNADPKIFPEAVYIPELTYLDAIELAYSGAQIIHPKTIKPLQNKGIPLYVRPFGDKTKPGSVIKGEMDGRIDVPILIVKHDQILVSIRPKDFSFVLQERMGSIITMFEQERVKINLIQSSAVNLTICVDRSRNLTALGERLQNEFRVVYNDDMELLTIRGYNEELRERYANQDGVYLTQRTRRIIRVVRKVVS